MFGVSKFYDLFKEVSYTHQGWFYLIKKYSNIVEYYYNLK